MKSRFLKNKIKKIIPEIVLIYKHAFYTLYRNYISNSRRKNFGFLAQNVTISPPFVVSKPQNCFLYENVGIGKNANIITHEGKFIVKKYSVSAANLTVVCDNHISTVGIPQFLLGKSHINDYTTDIIVEEDVWIGTNVTLLPGAHIGRGAIVGACAVINKKVPPYSIVVGIPGKIIAVKFSIEQILKHEERLYPEEERYSKEYLQNLFKQNFYDKKVFGLETEINEIQIEKLNFLIDKFKVTNFSKY